MPGTEPDSASGFHRFSWDGLSFEVPEDWDLSMYEFIRRGVSSLQMQDDHAIRLEAEWLRPGRRIDEQRLRARYEKSAKKITGSAKETTRIGDLPRGWSAFLYTMPGKEQFVTAFWLAPAKDLFCFFRLYFERVGKTKPMNVLRRLAESFAVTERGLRRWDVYDVSFELDSRFRLVKTRFEGGRKYLLFESRLRQLYVWQFSLADILLKKQSAGEWAAEFLNKTKEIRGPLFVARPDAGVTARRRRRPPFVQYEEIGRLCFRYRIAVRHLRDRNALFLAVYNFRSPDDLRRLIGEFKLDGKPVFTPE